MSEQFPGSPEQPTDPPPHKASDSWAGSNREEPQPPGGPSLRPPVAGNTRPGGAPGGWPPGQRYDASTYRPMSSGQIPYGQHADGPTPAGEPRGDSPWPARPTYGPTSELPYSVQQSWNEPTQRLLPMMPPQYSAQPGNRTKSRLLAVAALSLVLGLGGGVAGALLVNQADGGHRQAPVASSSPALSVSGGRDNSPVVAVADKVLPSVVSLDVRGSAVEVAGSGFVYDSQGDVVTNNHVVEPAVGGGQIVVSLPDGRTVAGTIVGRSPAYDIAVIKLADFSNLSKVSLGASKNVQVGESVVAIGSPLGLNSTVTSGIISATQRPVTAGGEGETSYIDALQTDAAINPGNSGGPLVDLAGRVIGVNSAIATVGGSSAMQSGNIGVGFSIPIDQVTQTVQQILKTGHAVYPVIGAQVSVANGSGGARVEAVTPGSPAANAGIRSGDVIKSIDGQVVADGVELIVKIRSFEPGQKVNLIYLRDASPRSAYVILGKKIG